MDTRREVIRITVRGLIVNFFLTVSKILGGIFGKSEALLADGVHSFTDISTDVMVIVGAKYWTQPCDDDHPHGHRRIENVVTILLGLTLLGVGSFLLYRSMSGLAVRHDAVRPCTYTIWLAMISIVSKEWLYRYTALEGRRIRSSAVTANAWHHRSDAFSSIPVLAALLLAVSKPEWGFVDEIGAVLVAVIIIQISVKFICSSFSKLVDRGAGQETRERLEKIVFFVPGVKGVHAVRTRYLGSAIAVDLHVEVDPLLSVREGHRIAEEIETRILGRETDVVDVVVHVEPEGEGYR
ncbi:MAG: cation diffusion facilitator family transporter [Candidatus Wallbacteria bacterium]|nr:cation diffusion facilitator family transporter [Candidatus Wallbacteria bacterium]